MDGLAAARWNSLPRVHGTFEPSFRIMHDERLRRIRRLPGAAVPAVIRNQVSRRVALARSPVTSRAPSLQGYPAWLRRTFPQVPEVAMGKAYHDEVAERLKGQVEASAFWRELLAKVPSISSDYYLRTDTELMAWPHDGAFSTKTWDSLLDKTYRKNVLANSRFPEPPEGGWVLPPTCYSVLDDVVRTRFVVRYLDGVHELGEAIRSIADESGHDVTPELVATDAGYYAAHVVVRQQLVVATAGLSPIELSVGCEIQVTTQAKEVITKLLHRTYEVARLGDAPPDWKWDYESRAFAANYLGHVLHYLEGRVMNVRDTDRERPTW